MRKEDSDILRPLGIFSSSKKLLSVIQRFPDNLITEVKAHTAIVTGANSGIGKGIATALARLGCHVVFACRNLQKGTAAIKDILSQNEALEESCLCLIEMDLASLQSVKDFAEKVKVKVLNGDLPRVKLLVFNAGILPFNYNKTKEGLEPNFGVNHLGHFFLFKRLVSSPEMLTPELRVVSMSSHGHYSALSGVDYTDGQEWALKVAHATEEDRSAFFTVWGCYGAGKLCNVLFARYLTNKTFNGVKVTAASCNPGVVHTNAGYENFIIRWLKPLVGPLFMQNIDQGGTSALTIALLPNKVLEEKLYFGSDCKPLPPSPVVLGEKGQQAEEALWKLSEDLCALFLEGKPMHSVSKL